MDSHRKKKDGEKKCKGSNRFGRSQQVQESDLEPEDQRGATHMFTEWQSPNDYGDGNADIFNLQRLAMENHKSPFPDIQFDILDNEADTDDNGCSYNVATGTKKKSPTRMDSWEDNWLFQQKKCDSRTATDGRNKLMSMRMYDTIDEQKYQDNEDYEKDESEASDCSGDCKSAEVQRVERPCVRTSSSSSEAEESEDSESLETSSRKSSSNQDDKIPFLESNPSTPGNSDSTDSSRQARELQEQEDNKDVPSIGQHFTRERTNDFAKNSLSTESPKRSDRQCSGKILKAQDAENDDSDDSIKDELVKSHEDNPSCSYSVNPMLPKLLVEQCNSPRPVSGTKSCTSEDSSSDEFEKKAAAYRGRRRASWCPLETPATAKKRGKRRTPLLPLRVDDDEPEMEIKPLATDVQALVGLERQMLRRNAHHSSFRAKKASSNFVLNPLYVPEGEGVHDPRGLDHLLEPDAMQHLQPTKSESGYSSCSPDSMINQNHMLLPQRERQFDLVARHDAPSPRQHRLQSNPRVTPADPESSFLW